MENVLNKCRKKVHVLILKGCCPVVAVQVNAFLCNLLGLHVSHSRPILPVLQNNNYVRIIM